jgi:hypothetical protein
MARPYLVYADLDVTHGDELVRVKGYGDRIEVLHSSMRFFLKVLRKSYTLRYSDIVALDHSLRRLELTVGLKTNYFCITILGANARKWVRSAFRFVIPI